MSNVTVHVSGKETVDLMCLRCGNTREIPVESLPAGDNKYRIKCKCGYSYLALFDKRRFYRKKTCLGGVYFRDNHIKDEIIEISDISITGLCFIANGNGDLEKGQVINLTFVLDNASHDTVKCKATVRQLRDTRVGVEFLNLPPGMQKILGFYLFNSFDKDE
jgi:c-di-GMP-binding flagellar brake protein YcgR